MNEGLTLWLNYHLAIILQDSFRNKACLLFFEYQNVNIKVKRFNIYTLNLLTFTLQITPYFLPIQLVLAQPARLFYLLLILSR